MSERWLVLQRMVQQRFAQVDKAEVAINATDVTPKKIPCEPVQEVF